MKKITGFLALLLAVLLCVGAVSAAAETVRPEAANTYAERFKTMLSGLGLNDELGCTELIHHYPDDVVETPDWVLMFGGAVESRTPVKAVFGASVVTNDQTYAPFKLGYGVYDVKKGIFYDLIDAWQMGFDGLHEAFADLTGDDVSYEYMGQLHLIGDVDNDNMLSILDATRIQRILARLNSHAQTDDLSTMKNLRGYDLQYLSDYDRDGARTILDATKIQRKLANLPNIVDSKVIDSCRTSAWTDSNGAVIARSPDEIDQAVNRLIGDALIQDGYQTLDVRKYNDAYFKNHAIAVAHLELTSGSYRVSYVNTAIGRDNILRLNFTYSGDDPLTDDLGSYIYFVELDNAFLDDIDGVEPQLSFVQKAKEDTLVSFTIEMNRRIDKSLDPGDPEIAVVTSAADAEETMQRMTRIDFLPNESGLYGEPVFDSARYNDAFFAKKALVMMHLEFGSGSFHPSIDRVVLTADHQLVVNYSERSDGMMQTEDMSDYFVMLAIDKGVLTDVRDVRLELIGGHYIDRFDHNGFEYRDIFVAAMEGITNPEYTCVALLSYNFRTDKEHEYLFLCTKRLFPDEQTTFALVNVCHDANKQTYTPEIRESEVDASFMSEDYEPVPGGWGKGDSLNLTDEVKAAFEQAYASGHTSSDTTVTQPVALLGTAIADAPEYMILCRSMSLYSDDWYYTIVEVYDGAEAYITATYEFPEEPYVPGDPFSPEITDELRHIFDWACEENAGVSLAPVAFLGSQTNGGVDYHYLCTCQPEILDPPDPVYAFVTVHKDSDDGLLRISSIMQSGVKAPSDEPSPGGYIAADSPVLPDSVKAAFERAYEPQDGVTIRPVALLAEQVVSGHNYLILCRTTPVVEDPVEDYCFAKLYVPFDGAPSIRRISEPENI